MWLSAIFVLAGIVGVTSLVFDPTPTVLSTLAVLLIPGFLGLLGRTTVRNAREDMPSELKGLSRIELARYLWERNPTVVLSIGALVLLVWAFLVYLRWG